MFPNNCIAHRILLLYYILVTLSLLGCFSTALVPISEYRSRISIITQMPTTTTGSVDEQQSMNRRHFLAMTAASPLLLLLLIQPSHAFEGGVGGLGKTKPNTGIAFLSPPFQSKEGWVSAEVLVGSSPLLIEFHSPFLPLLSSSNGLEVRKLPDPESAFCQIIISSHENSRYPPQQRLTKKDVQQLLEQHILSQAGKFGAYLTPTDVKVTSVDPNNDALWKVRFTAYTPGLRESDRQLILNVQRVGTSEIVVLVAGTTLQRYAKQEVKLRQMVESFRVIPAPSTKLRS